MSSLTTHPAPKARFVFGRDPERAYLLDHRHCRGRAVPSQKDVAGTRLLLGLELGLEVGSGLEIQG